MHRRQFLGSAMAASLLALTGPERALAAGPVRLLPPALRPGDMVGLVSPSSATDDSLKLQLATEAMQALCFHVRPGERGGAGAARLLPLLDYGLIRRNPKVLLGYSDITALHCAIQAQTGLVTFHGPIGSGSWNRFVVDQFRRVFFQRELLEYRNPPDEDEDELVPRRNRTMTIHGGRARGRLLGGNLSVLVGLAGSPYLPA